jgi:hypothetical protein
MKLGLPLIGGVHCAGSIKEHHEAVRFLSVLTGWKRVLLMKIGDKKLLC